MTYATLDLLTARHGERLLIQLTDRDVPPSGAVVTAVVDRALADTDAQIDSYLLGRYALPLGETPPVLVDLAAAIAVYKLHVYTPEAKIEQDYRDAVAALERIGKGVQRLPIAGAEPVSSGSEGVQAIDRARDITPENMGGFI